MRIFLLLLVFTSNVSAQSKYQHFDTKDDKIVIENIYNVYGRGSDEIYKYAKDFISKYGAVKSESGTLFLKLTYPQVATRLGCIDSVQYSFNVSISCKDGRTRIMADNFTYTAKQGIGPVENIYYRDCNKSWVHGYENKVDTYIRDIMSDYKKFILDKVRNGKEDW